MYAFALDYAFKSNAFEKPYWSFRYSLLDFFPIAITGDDWGILKNKIELKFD